MSVPSIRPDPPARPLVSAAGENRVCAVVVTFQPWTEVVANLRALRRQVPRVIVVDNAVSAASRALLAPLASEPGYELVFNRENLGVAAALNQGLVRAQAGGDDWLATFDQDSRIPADFVAGLLAAHKRWQSPERVAVLAPLYRDRGLGFIYSPNGPVRPGETVDSVVTVTATSGSLVAVRAACELGGFREDFFIDCVDFEFCLRCRRRSWQVLEVRGVVLDHAQGEWRQRRLLWKRPRVNDYSALRRYYQARNRLILYARLGGVDPRWTLRDAWGYACDGLKLFLFCEHRATKLGAMLTGVWHAATGRRGAWGGAVSAAEATADVSFRREVPVLHYVGYDDDRGGIVSVIRALAGVGRGEVLLGVNAGARQWREPVLPVLELPRLGGEQIGLVNAWRARTVARAVQTWLRADARRVFHGHSRAGLLVGLWLWYLGERRLVVSVHCYGRRRWFYRWAARVLGDRLYWLSPAMKRYYVVGPADWTQCIPGCVPVRVAGAWRTAEAKVIRLGGVGALVRWKRWELVLSALAALPAPTRARFRFRHIGGPDGSGEAARYERELARLTVRLGLVDIVEWRGAQPSSLPLLTETDSLIIAAENEPFSVAMLESLQAGVPVLAADSGGAADVLTVVGGELFRSGDAADLARALARLARESVLARVAPAAVERFTAPVVATQWADVYARL